AENQSTGPLPQYFADEFGWEEMARKTARIYKSLSSEEQTRTAIFANSYGQAGAIDFFGPRLGLPKSICNHQSYWLWGPRDYDGSIVIVLAARAEPPPSLQDRFLDNFVGDWQVERKMSKGHVAQTSVRCEWVLKHQFIEFHYGLADATPEYEAFVFIGFDDDAKNYV